MDGISDGLAEGINMSLNNLLILENLPIRKGKAEDLSPPCVLVFPPDGQSVWGTMYQGLVRPGLDGIRVVGVQV